MLSTSLVTWFPSFTQIKAESYKCSTQVRLKIKHLKIFTSNRILDHLLKEWISSAIVEFNLFLRPPFIFAWGCLYLFDLLVLKRKFWHLHDDLLSQLLPYLTYVSYWSSFYLVNSSRVLLNLMGGSPTLIKYICEHFFPFVHNS